MTRKVFEPNEGQLSQARKQPHRSHIKNIEVSCVKCGYTTKFSLNAKRFLDTQRNGRWLCKDCLEKDKKELQQAMLNLARNKKAPKK